MKTLASDSEATAEYRSLRGDYASRTTRATCFVIVKVYMLFNFVGSSKRELGLGDDGIAI